MDTLIQLNKGNSIVEVIKQQISLFESFDNVYLFGSALGVSETPNDIDILLIYSEYSIKMLNDLRIICSVLEEATGLLVDLTVLSVEEEKDTEFLKRINPKYIKIK